MLTMTTMITLTHDNTHLDADKDDQLEAHTIQVHKPRLLVLKMLMFHLIANHIAIIVQFVAAVHESSARLCVLCCACVCVCVCVCVLFSFLFI